MVRVSPISIIWNILSVIFGWSLFVYWWTVVLHGLAFRYVLWTLAVIAFMAIGLTIGARLWVRHNRRLARHGSRGSATAFRVPLYERDRISRELILPDSERLLDAPLLVVTVTSGQKIYAQAAAFPPAHP